MTRHPTFLLFLAVLSFGTGCQGIIDNIEEGESITPMAGGEPVEPMVDDDGNLNLPELEPVPARLWALTPVQMANTIEHAMPHVRWTTNLNDMTGFSSSADQFVLGERNVDTLSTVAQEIGTSAAEEPSRLSGCLPEGFDDADCRSHVLEILGRQLFRRPVAAEERAFFEAFWDEERVAPGATDANALASVVASMILSPSFIYRDELAEGMMDDHAIASAISYFITDAPPDAELQQAADAGELGSADGRAEHARRLMETAELAPGVRRFFDDMFGYGNVRNVVNDAYPEFTPEIRDAMAEETQRFIDHVLWSDDARLETLLSANYTFVNGPLAEFYGMEATPTDFEQVTQETPRLGLLGLGSFSARFGHGTYTDPVKRGHYIREQLLCGELSAVPDNVQGIPWEDGDTERDGLVAHSRGGCQGCHIYMDGPGLAFENFDSVGRWRDTISVYESETESFVPSDGPVDASGEFVRQFSAGETLAFEDYNGMVEGLSTFSELEFCVVKRAFRWVYGTDNFAGDPESVQSVTSRFNETGGDLIELFVSLISADEFFVRGESK